LRRGVDLGQMIDERFAAVFVVLARELFLAPRPFARVERLEARVGALVGSLGRKSSRQNHRGNAKARKHHMHVVKPLGVRSAPAQPGAP
jgi:hypothetical protein